MSWHYSLALVEAYSAASCSDGKPSAPSSETPTHGMFWSPDKTTDASHRSRSGMTYAPSTGIHGADVLTWCLEASHVRISAPQGAVKESTGIEAASGWKWHESSVKYDPASRSWKTRQCSLLGDLEPASETWPRWGIMRDGESWELSTPALLTSENEYGYWPTHRTTGLDGGSNSRKAAKARGMWPTPNQRDWKDTGSTQGNRKSPNLGTMVHQFATPQARDYRTGSTDRWENPERSRNLNDQIGGKLNPSWVAWLMGWPIEWTACAASATDKFRQWCASHGISYLK